MTPPKSKAEMGFLLEHASWPAFMADGGGIIRRANQAAIAFFGPVLESDSTSLSSILAEGNEAAREQFLSTWERSAQGTALLKFRGKGAVVTAFNTCICTLHRDGEKRFVFQLFRDPAVGLPPAGATAASKEASAGAAGKERSAAAKERGSAAKESSIATSLAQKQKLDCAMQLARTVALDFNNVLTTILGHTSLVLSHMEPDHAWRNSLLEVEKAAERAAEMAYNLAIFSRQERQPDQGTPSNLNPLLRRVIDMFRQAAPSLDWNLDLNEHLYSARFDETKVQQVFIKIIENALEAITQNGRLSIATRNLDVAEPLQDNTVRLEPGCYVCVEITDDGGGIEPDVLPRIFEPFFTTKEGHRGLGLAWVYGVATNHGGGVAVTSQPGQGTTVRVYLPAIKRVIREHSVADGELGGHQTVLLVDDEEPLLSLGQTILSSYGYRVLTATGGAKALELLSQAQEPIDLLITDLAMPQMSGRELIERVRAMTPDMPILCTSGYVLRATSTEELEAFLPKPFTSQELLCRVKQMLGTVKKT